MFSPIGDLSRAALFALAHWCGGSLGGAVVVAAVTLRMAMLPLSLPATRRRLRREARLRALAPELTKLQKRHAGQSAALATAVQRLYEQHGIAMFDRAGFVDALLQFPPATALYSAIRSLPRGAGRFLWIGDLVTPDRALTSVAALVSAGLAWLATAGGESSRAAQIAPFVTAAVTFAILSHLSAGIALYSITNSVIGGAEQALARRMLRHGAP